MQRELYRESQASAWASSAYDSTGRYWSLQTDSPFYYHPDRGLYAFGGQLALLEGQVQRKATLQTDSNAIYHHCEQSESSYSAKPSRESAFSYWLWRIAALLLTFFAAWRFWRRF